MHARAVLGDVKRRYRVPVLNPIPRSVKFAEAPSVGATIVGTSPSSSGARAYFRIADGLLRAWRFGGRKVAPARTSRMHTSLRPPVSGHGQADAEAL